jgi:hypothetical protein
MLIRFPRWRLHSFVGEGARLVEGNGGLIGQAEFEVSPMAMRLRFMFMLLLLAAALPRADLAPATGAWVRFAVADLGTLGGVDSVANAINNRRPISG